MTPSQELQNSISMYEELHASPRQFFRGRSLTTHLPDLFSIVEGSNVKSILDYGCGKAELWEKHGLRGLLKVKKIFLYDPGYVKFQARPIIPADLVVCVDVMEHIPENCVDEVLNDIESLSKKAILFSISTREAAKLLPNGENAHVTIKPEEWWMEKINKINRYVKVRFLD